MGLSTSHGCWHGPYSAFTRWRNNLAKVAGYNVKMVQEEDKTLWPTVMLDWGHITEDNLMGTWDKTPDDPLLILLAHSDCDGDIFPENAVALAGCLEKLLPFLKEEWEQEATQRFINGLKAAANANEPVMFY